MELAQVRAQIADLDGPSVTDSKSEERPVSAGARWEFIPNPCMHAASLFMHGALSLAFGAQESSCAL